MRNEQRVCLSPQATSESADLANIKVTDSGHIVSVRIDAIHEDVLRLEVAMNHLRCVQV